MDSTLHTNDQSPSSDYYTSKTRTSGKFRGNLNKLTIMITTVNLKSITYKNKNSKDNKGILELCANFIKIYTSVNKNQMRT